MTIIEFFNPLNIEHLKAYKSLENTGVWPKGFLPDDIEIPSGWSWHIQSKIVEQFLKEKLGG